MNWYDEYQHLGYDWDGNKIPKPLQGDQIDNFLKRMEDPDFWRTVKDKQTGQNVVLSESDVSLIKRLQTGKIPDTSYDDYAPWIEWFSSQTMEVPICNVPDSKASFLPSRHEAKIVAKMVNAIKLGLLKPRKPKDKDPRFFLLWKSDDQAEEMRRIHDHIPPPKFRLPGHSESYNPPAEYLFNEKEMEDWKKHEEEPWKRKYNFIPQKHESLLRVPAYENYVKERFERCMDLYLCPRGRRMRTKIDPEDLIPKLPSPRDLQPFPTTQAILYKGHTGMIRSITVEPTGEYIASGSDDGTVKVWEVKSGRCLRTLEMGGVVRRVEWCPNISLSLIAIAVDQKVILANPRVGDRLAYDRTDTILESPPDPGAYVPPSNVQAAVKWEQVEPNGKDFTNGWRLVLPHFKEVAQATWHQKGDYFASVMPQGLNRSVIVHQLSKRQSQLPFSKSKGLVQCVAFHPLRPFFFVATQRHIRIYDLVKQELSKKLLPGAQWISSLSVHPAGDNVLVGTYDKKVMWFDLDLSTYPYQTLRHHRNAVRSVAFHRRYPLFASCSDDGSVIISHGKVYSDLMQNPLIVPLKKLWGHEKKDDFCVMSVIFHPTQPWVFSSGADGTIRLFS